MSKTFSSSYSDIVLSDAGYNPVSITSAGSITGSNAAIYGQSATAWMITNSGSVAGTNLGIALAAGGTIANDGTGRIFGGSAGVSLTGAAGTVINQGSILGTLVSGSGVALGAGGFVSNASSGTITGGIFGVQISGGAGTIDNAGAVIGTGGVAVQLASGYANRVVVAPGASFTGTVNGGNTIGATQVSTLELTSSGSVGTLSGLGSQFVNLAAVTVDVSAEWTISSAILNGQTLTNSGTLTDILLMSPGANLTNTANALITSATNNAIYQGSSAGPITITNAGTISQSSSLTGIDANGGGTITNQATILGGSRGVYLNAPGTVLNTGTIGASAPGSVGVGLHNGGTVSNSSTGQITGGGFGIYSGGSGSITNDGSISGAGNSGVAFSASGTLTNTKGAQITGHYSAVAFRIGAGSVLNDGTIQDSAGTAIVLSNGGDVTNQADGVILGHDAGVVVGTITGTIVNQGSIEGTANNGGVGLFAGGAVSNLLGGIITGYRGVEISGGAGTVTNAGSIGATGAHAVQMAAGYSNLLIVDPGASFTGQADGGNIIGSGTVSTLELASAASAGGLSGLGTQFIHFAAITVDAGASWTFTGSNTIEAGATFTALTGAVVTDTATLENDGAIVLNPSTMTVAGLIGSGSASIQAGSTLNVQGTVAGGETIAFGGAGAYLHFETPVNVVGSVTNFDVNETIDLTGIDPASVSFSSGKLNFTGGSFALSLASGGGVQAVASADGAAVSVLCFCANTLIQTPRGQVAVQDLAIGDAVVTRSNAVRRIVWIGTGRVLATRGRRNAATPVIVRKGALADNVPTRDLRLTKGHALYLDGVLIPVEYLINHRSIAWDDRAQEVELFHIELESHDVLIANGAPAESYRDDGNRWLFHNANAGWHLPPQTPCAPVLTGGPIVDDVWRRLLERAGPRPGLPLTQDADVHLLVDGQRLDAASRHGNAYIFVMTETPDAVQIVSRAAAPDQLGTARDPRVLGVAFQRIVLRQGTRFRTFDGRDARLISGFHAFETESGLRWTDGDAALPMGMFEGFRGPVELVLHLACSTTYLVESETRKAA